MGLYLYDGKLLVRGGALATSQSCCCADVDCGFCDNLTGTTYPDGCFKTLGVDVYCNTPFSRQESYGDCQDTIGFIFKGPCSGPAEFEGVPARYADCTCASIVSTCTTYSVNAQENPETGECLCLKNIGLYRYRYSSYVFVTATCKWVKVHERLVDIATNCDGAGDCECPPYPDCTPPPHQEEYDGCQGLCDNPLP